jgi:CoA:oxalate CoA-transferase
MLDCQLSLLENAVARYSLTGESPKPIGNRHSSIVPFETFKTKDSTIMLAVGNDRLWEKFTSLIDNEKLKKEKFKTNDMRSRNYKELKNILIPIFKGKTTDDWVKILNEKDIPNSPINKIEDVVKNEQLLARNMINKEKLDEEKELYVVNSPLKFEKGKDFDYTKAPDLGKDTDEIMLKEIGLTEEEIKELKEKNII